MKIKILGDKEKFLKPTKGTERSAAYDLYVQEDVEIKQGRQVIPMGFAIELDPNTAAEIHPRSGFASKGIEGHLTFCCLKQVFDEECKDDKDITLLETFIRGQQEFCKYIHDKIKERFNADVTYGLIDEDYRNEIGVIINNDNGEFVIKRGTRIAQMLIINVPLTAIEYVDELSETKRKGGFGHTGA